MRDQLKLTFHIFAELNSAENAILVYKLSAPLFTAALERLGVAVQHISNISDPYDKFVFVKDGQAEHLFNTWKE